jgi:hypothetical protein
LLAFEFEADRKAHSRVVAFPGLGGFGYGMGGELGRMVLVEG